MQRAWAKLARCIWTQPLVVRSPLGILTAIDLFGVGLVAFVVVCFTANLTGPRVDSINHGDEIPGLEKRCERFGVKELHALLNALSIVGIVVVVNVEPNLATP